VKDPAHAAIDLHHQFVGYLEISQLEAAVAAQHFIMVSGDVNNPGTIAHHVDYFFYHNQVGRWEIAFIEIPDVNKIAV
jgi:hypothetical protein